MMRQNLHSILQISSSDGGGGGGFIPATLHTGFKKHGFESHILVKNKFSSDSTVAYITWDCELIDKIVTKLPFSPKNKTRIQYILKIFFNPKLALRIVKGEEDFAVFRTKSHLKKAINELKPDIVQCHNLHMWYFGLENLSWLSKEVPTVFTLHDAWLLSGHCALSLNCDKWRDGCVQCNQLGLYPPLLRDASHKNWLKKRELYLNLSIHVVTPSQWLMDKVNESILKPAIVSQKVIYNGIDLSVYHPRDKMESRYILGIPKDVYVLLFAASGLRDNPWKDFKMLQRVLEIVSKANLTKPVLCLALGDIGNRIEYSETLHLDFIPFVSDAERVATYYCAADIYVHPAKIETFGLTVAESLVCGTPVVATNVGGIPEIVIHDKSGYLVDEGDDSSMSNYIISLLNDDELRSEMGCFGANDAKQRFDQKRMVNEYLEYYQEILSRDSS